MLIDFFIQNLFATIFFLGITGIGSVLLGIFNFKTNNPFLYSAMAFFLSLCLYIILLIPFLTYLPNKLLVLKIFSGVYFLISFLILSYFYQAISWRKLKVFFKRNWPVFLAVFFVLGVFFLQLYRTALFDEWLHRPVVQKFVDDGEFPFINPYNENYNFNSTYHYGLYIPASAIKLFTNLTAAESLDVLKLSFAMASFFLIYGIVYEFSRKRNYSILGGVFILFSGGLYFTTSLLFSDNFNIWEHSISFFNDPVLFLMAGITWINLMLSVAFIWLTERVFREKNQFNFLQILVFILLLGGFYLISELFVVLILILFGFSVLFNLLSKKISVKKIVVILVILIVGLLGIVFLVDGVARNLIGENKSFEIGKLLTYRHFGHWGYPSSSGILGKSSWMAYLKSYSLEFLILIFFTGCLLFKKSRKQIFKTFKKFPLIWLALFVCALVPFLFSTIYGDVNLAKLKELWPPLLYILFFYLIVKLNYKKIILITFLILFIISSLPMMITNFGIQWGNNDRSENARCRENNLCYPEDEVKVLQRFEKENPNRNKVILINRKDEAKLIDKTNSKLEFIGGNITEEFLKKSQAEYLFYNSRVFEDSTHVSREVIWNNFEGYLSEENTAILRRIRK